MSPTSHGSLTTDDNLQLHTQQWTPEDASRAVIVLVHGYAEHCGRYGHVAQALVNEGASVFAYDQRGYGRSEGRRAYVASFENYLDDLALVLTHVRTTQPNLPLFLFGHSMGGLVVLKYVLDRSPSVRGLMLSAPAIEINPDLAPLLRTLAQILGRFFPTLPTTRSPEGAISRDPDVVADAEQDPLNYHGRVPARTGAEMLRAGDEVRDQLDALQTPFLVFHGTADRLTTPNWSRRLYERASTSDKTLHLYDGLYHETFNEPEQATVLSDLTAWLRDRVEE
ncbi:lysophospholipase [Salinibacter sp. 10B]|uniref:alpha/beta hydrolase n=1 Tax=Salinibacter sp. 10B TaxID=1923971 RepID=UPI000CF51533|nr:alpha/beta hydrolase [Salinibacter sp. 10B]PQJ33778.1 lysophospholipase [Salinibacter sp. 10B]